MPKNLHGSKRKGYKSTGNRKLQANKNRGRQKPLVDQDGVNWLKIQAKTLHPDEGVKAKAASLNDDDRKKSAKKRQMELVREPKKRPDPLPFCLLETVAFTSMRATERLLTAASLRVKSVRRHPGWVLQRTYNLKDRPIEIV